MDGGYEFLDHSNSGYSHDTHNRRHGDFRLGLSSTSSIESLWNALKNKIKKPIILFHLGVLLGL